MNIFLAAEDGRGVEIDADEFSFHQMKRVKDCDSSGYTLRAESVIGKFWDEGSVEHRVMMAYDVKRWVRFSKKWPETLGLELVGELPEFAGGGTIVIRIKSELVDQLVGEQS